MDQLIDIRVRTRERFIKLRANQNGTLLELKRIIEKESGVPIHEQQVCFDFQGEETLESDRHTLYDHGIGDGCMLFMLKNMDSKAKRVQTAKKKEASGDREYKRTPHCTHGPNGRCLHCLPPSEETKNGDNLEWMCNHPDDKMCLNCMPLKKGDKVELEMLCQHGPEGRCINCLPPDVIKNKKHMSFEEYLAEKRAKCNHSEGTVCVNCTPPSMVSYRIKPDCGKHKPWPEALCNQCAPPPVTLQRQPYRHVDYVEFRNQNAYQRFVQLWVETGKSVNRTGILFGKYAKSKHHKGIRAIVEAIYEPPQGASVDGPEGSVRRLDDPRWHEVMAVAEGSGLEAVGWIFTQPKRDCPISAYDLREAAKLQIAYTSDAFPGSQLVTISVSVDDDGEVDAKGWMASDQFTAMVRDEVVSEDLSHDPELVFTRESKRSNKIYVPPVIRNDKEKGAQEVNEFEVEFALVEVGTGGAKKRRKTTFARDEFVIENRSDFGFYQNNEELMKFIKNRGELHEALSDFHCLLYIAKVFDAETAQKVAQCCISGESVPDGVQLMLEHM
eukprot:TRINITY_DN773066_c0_g1_i1.p1 TRINITY_DN773066_c0_g1~~TRINITY_DN773066_c0_g1_i1.p1  ORF type:complete len:555 (-),score=135.14 TRINITY_DN773066_c0_g1_i1:184-1848(-)